MNYKQNQTNYCLWLFAMPLQLQFATLWFCGNSARLWEAHSSWCQVTRQDKRRATFCLLFHIALWKATSHKFLGDAPWQWYDHASKLCHFLLFPFLPCGNSCWASLRWHISVFVAAHLFWKLSAAGSLSCACCPCNRHALTFWVALKVSSLVLQQNR